MDNTRVIPTNGTPYGMANEKLLKVNGISSQKNVPRFDPRKNFINNGQTYTMCGGSGAQIFMNTDSIVTATNMEFLPPTVRSKASICNSIGLANMPTIKVLKQTSFATATATATTTTHASAVLSGNNPIAFLANTNTQPTPELLIEQNELIITRNSSKCGGSLTDSNSKLFGESPGNEQEPTEGNTLVNTIKSIFSYLIKPIIDKTAMIVVGSDSGDGGAKTMPQPSMAGKQMFWSDCNRSPQNTANHNNSTSMYYDNHSSDSFCYSSEMSNVYMNFKPDTYFDCDDYIDGGEDTIDFVADSTNIQWQPSAKENIFYDCITKPVVSETTVPSASPSPSPPPKSTDHVPACEENQTKSELDVSTTNEHENTDNVQYNTEEKMPLNCPKYAKSNRNSYRRKRKGKRKPKQGNRKRNMAPYKNRHEKVRHEVELNIHDDIDDCTIAPDGNVSYAYSYSPDDDDEEEADIDLEIIDVDDHLPKSPAKTVSTSTVSITPAKSLADIVPIETPIPSPEIIPSGCIFTRFFRLDNTHCKQMQQSLPMRFHQKQVTPVKSMRERSNTARRASETESDDSFIVFEDSSPKSATSTDDPMPKYAALKDTYRRQRQLSEGSDDFILFVDDTVDSCHRYDTTDEDFTDSTDDSDSSEDESCDESDSCEFVSASNRLHEEDNNQPDSGFEDKRVRVKFNLCPLVHEIRAWKFAYSEARKGKWEQMGRDRERFEKRINDVSRILTPILAANHRQKIYEQRFHAE